MLDLSKLNHNQLLTVTADIGPLLIIAGAGTGKTRVLTTRIAYLVEQLHFNPHEILAITFTNKAAIEMRNRINGLLKHVYLPWIGTYHAICLKILKEDIHFLGRQNSFSVIDEEDQLSIIHDIFKEGEISTKDIKPKKALEIIQRVKVDEIDLFTINQLNALRKIGIHSLNDLQSFRYIIKNYEKKLLKANLLDFDDLLILTKKLLSEHDDVCGKWQNKFNYVLVDEFQDTNYLQFEIFNLLVNPKIKNVFVVGDPDQTIYTWRGAYPNIFMDFLTNFKDTKTFVLDTNYRSTKNILNVANNLIKHNELRISKNLTTPNPTGSNVIFFAGETSQIEVSYIAKQIKAIIKQKQYAYQDIAVLYRAKHLSRTIEQEFINDGIPYLIYGDIRFYQRKEIKDLVAYLKLICNPQDELSLKRIINVPSRGIGLKTIENIEKYAASQSISFYDALLKISNDEIPSGISKPTIKKFMVLMELIMQQTKDLPLVKKIEHIIDVIHYQEYLKTFDQFETRWENVQELIVAIEEFQSEHPNRNLSDFLEEISLYTDIEQSKAKQHDFVSLMTIHFAKGTEFKVVFIIGMNEGVFPIQHLNYETNMEEERRIAYVGITRAMERLFLTCNLGFSPISADKLTPSRFVKEIGEHNYVTDTSNIATISKADLEWYDSSKNIDWQKNYDSENEIVFKIGDVIAHTIFGSGIVVGINDDMLEIAFKAPFGVKSLIKNHKSIKRLKN